MQKEIIIKDSLNNDVLTSVSIPENSKNIVIISHGFQSSKESKLYVQLQEELNRLNIGTIRYDYYGNGRLYKTKENFGLAPDLTLTKTLASIQAVIDYALGLKIYDISLLGSSYGGLLSLISSIRNNSNVKCLVLKSPLIEPLEFWNNRLNSEKIKQWREDGEIYYNDLGEEFILNYSFYEDLQNYSVFDSVQNLNSKTLLVHGDCDSVVPIKKSFELAKKLDIEVSVIEGANHGYKEEGKFNEMKNLIVSFFKEELN